MYKIVLIRHGESEFNRQNRFCGWIDADLSEKGIQEAVKAGQTLKRENFSFDQMYCSVLKRAIRTLWLIEEQMDLMYVPVEFSWKLNERHYGALQGLNKAETAQKFGEEQVQIWRRSYDVRPPALDFSDPRNSKNDLKYSALKPEEIPLAECLKDTVERVVPYWQKTICPAIKSGKKVLVSAHGNSLRALVKYLDNVSEKEIVSLNIPTGIPLVYELDSNLKPAKHYYLGNEKEIEQAIQSVKNQGKAKA